VRDSIITDTVNMQLHNQDLTPPNSVVNHVTNDNQLSVALQRGDNTCSQLA